MMDLVRLFCLELFIKSWTDTFLKSSMLVLLTLFYIDGILIIEGSLVVDIATPFLKLINFGLINSAYNILGFSFKGGLVFKKGLPGVPSLGKDDY